MIFKVINLCILGLFSALTFEYFAHSGCFLIVLFVYKSCKFALEFFHCKILSFGLE